MEGIQLPSTDACTEILDERECTGYSTYVVGPDQSPTDDEKKNHCITNLGHDGCRVVRYKPYFTDPFK
jgi:hypothetical protein